MKFDVFILFGVLLNARGSVQRVWVTSDELENHISPEDLKEFFSYYDTNSQTPPSRANTHLSYADIEDAVNFREVPEQVDCFGLGSISRTVLSFFNMKPDDPFKVNTHFYFSSRKMPKRVQVYPGDQFGLEWVDFNSTRKTIIIVHGFMSHSNASWVNDMAEALLQWANLNVIAVDWSGGGNTWKYWRAVANTRRVGSDITIFLKQLMRATGAKAKDFHFIGHSLGAHIASFASIHCGRVARITGLDPAQPCFATTNDEERLDPSDADYVDVIHTNGRLLQKIGFGMPNPIGHADFYPNGGIKQPGCAASTRSIFARMPFSPIKLQQAVCSHGRAYVLFTESLINANCSFRAYRWDLTYDGVNSSLKETCDRVGSCAEMGIKAAGEVLSQRAHGPYILLTTDKEPFCVAHENEQFLKLELLQDLKKGDLKQENKSTTALPYADPMHQRKSKTDNKTTTGITGWLFRWLG